MFRRGAVHSYPARLLMKYFSFKIVWAHRLSPDQRYIMAAHPHGAFPFGNVLSLLVAPDAGGACCCEAYNAGGGGVLLFAVDRQSWLCE